MLRFRLIYSMLQGSQIIDQGGSYVFVVKGNQKSLLEQLRDDYDWDRRAAFTAVDGGHGRIETRTIRVSEDFADCPEWLDFPGARVGARLVSETTIKKTGQQRQPQTVYLLTNLRPQQASLAISILRMLGKKNIAEAMEKLSYSPQAALALAVP